MFLVFYRHQSFITCVLWQSGFYKSTACLSMQLRISHSIKFYKVALHKDCLLNRLDIFWFFFSISPCLILVDCLSRVCLIYLIKFLYLESSITCPYYPYALFAIRSNTVFYTYKYIQKYVFLYIYFNWCISYTFYGVSWDALI